MRPIPLLLLLAASALWSVDYDALAAQRYREAMARQEAAGRAADKAAVPSPPPPPPPRWVVPQGKPAAAPPAWAQGDWASAVGRIVIGARTVGLGDNPPLTISGVLHGDDWCVVGLDMFAETGPGRLVLRQQAGAVLLGSGFGTRGRPDYVEEWQALERR